MAKNGYLTHWTRLANAVVQLQRGKEAEQQATVVWRHTRSRVCVSSLTDHAGEAAFAWLDDDAEWAAFVSGALVATNLRYASVLGGVHPDTLGMDASTQDKPAMVDELDNMG